MSDSLPARDAVGTPTAGEVWAATVSGLGGLPGTTAGDVDARYAEPHRRYHVGAHVAAVVRDAEWLCAELGVADRSAVLLAACAHDVVYAARPGEDERASAQWARAALAQAGLDTGLAERVADLILATAAHEAPAGDAGAAALLDADLAILAADPSSYDAYVEAVRFEYRAVPDEQWRAGRAGVLRALVDRPALYASEPARRRWEAAARANVARELESLCPPVA